LTATVPPNRLVNLCVSTAHGLSAARRTELSTPDTAVTAPPIHFIARRRLVDGQPVVVLRDEAHGLDHRIHPRASIDDETQQGDRSPWLPRSESVVRRIFPRRDP